MHALPNAPPPHQTSQADLDQEFDHADTNDDGELDYKEFVRLMTPAILGCPTVMPDSDASEAPHAWLAWLSRQLPGSSTAKSCTNSFVAHGSDATFYDLF